MSELVDDVRSALLKAGRPPTYRERALLLAVIARTDGTERDVVDELRAARTALYEPGSDTVQRARRLARAVDAILEPFPPADVRLNRVRTPTRELVEPRPRRADIDG